MIPLAREAQRRLAGANDADNVPGAALPQPHLLTLQNPVVSPSVPQANVAYGTGRWTHSTNEALVDGGVFTFDRNLYQELMALGLYNDSVATAPYRYARTVMGDESIVYLRLGESGSARVANDMMGTQPPNLVTNPDFEVDVAGWNALSKDGVITVFQPDDSWQTSGQQSARVTATGVGANSYSEVKLGTRIGVVPGQAYALVGQMNVLTLPSGGNAQAQVSWYDANNTIISTQQIGTITNASGAVTISGTVIAPSNAASAQLFFGLYTAATGGTLDYNLDSLMFVPGATVPATFYTGNGGFDGNYVGKLQTPALPTIVANAVNTGTFAAGTYYYKLSAVNATGETPGSAEVSVTISAQNTITISWTAVPGAASYNLYRATVAGKENTSPALVASGITGTSYTDTGTATTAGATLAKNSALTTVPTLGQAGAITGDADTAVTLDGQTQFLDCGVVASAISPVNALSCECWFKTTSSSGVQALISNFGGSSLGYILRLNAGRMNMWVGGTAVISPVGKTYNDGVWHHMVGTWDGTTISIYGDGALLATAAFSGPLAYSTTNHLQIGTNSSSGIGQPASTMYNGTVDEVAIYTYALSPAQVLAHYNAGIGN